VLGARDVELLGISAVAGNISAAQAASCARRLVAAAGAQVDVVEADDAPARIAALPDGTRLLALGPLGNVAAALARDPSLAARVRVSVVGGNLSSRGRWPPLWPFEFNLAKDAAAARALFASTAARAVFPLDVCRALTVGIGELRRIARASPLGAYLVRHSWRWLAYAPLRYRALRFPLWDLVPALDALGLLPATHATRRLSCIKRGLLVDDAHATPADVLTSLDPAPALAALERLLR
jgi:inosine-uridine nucleoside N-ribohydrolase